MSTYEVQGCAVPDAQAVPGLSKHNRVLRMRVEGAPPSTLRGGVLVLILAI